MWIMRNLEQIIKKYVNDFPIVYIAGARQVGKTSLLRKVFPNFEFISLDIPSEVEAIENNPESFLNTHSKKIIFDEIQYLPSFFRYIKNKVDKENRMTNYILTGSQNFLMMQNLTESLAGRCAILNLQTIGFEELSDANVIKDKSFIQLILKGGYPELWKSNIGQEVWFSSYVATYLERDVRNILSIGSLRDFSRFMKLLAYRAGSILNYTDISKDVGVAVNTIKSWVSVLEASFQIIIIEPYYRNAGKRLVKSPKVYFKDSGLLCYLNNILNEHLLENSFVLGHIWESYVLQQLELKLFKEKLGSKIWFWRTSTGEEIDFVLDYGGRFILIEVKYAELIKSDDIKNIDIFKKQYGKESVIASYIISNTSNSYELDGVNIINIADFVKNKFSII
jgi:uncharacterized protein